MKSFVHTFIQYIYIALKIGLHFMGDRHTNDEAVTVNSLTAWCLNEDIKSSVIVEDLVYCICRPILRQASKSCVGTSSNDYRP